MDQRLYERLRNGLQGIQKCLDDIHDSFQRPEQEQEQAQPKLNRYLVHIKVTVPMVTEVEAATRKQAVSIAEMRHVWSLHSREVGVDPETMRLYSWVLPGGTIEAGNFRTSFDRVTQIKEKGDEKQ